MPDGAPVMPANGQRPAPDEVWARVREDYLAGISAPECCRRHGVGLTALRKRAASEGWRDPWDEGVLLEERVAGDLDQIEVHELEWIADRRMMRAVLRGDAVEALRWRRVFAFLAAEARAIDRLVAAEEAMECVHRDAHEAHDVNGVNGVSGPGA